MWKALVLLLAVASRLSECKVRLVEGSSSSEGRVEIFHSGSWGTVCDDRWDINDAKVVCRSLGLPDAVSAPTLASFGRGTGKIWLDEVKCSGDEKSLADCRHDGWGQHNCGHGEDAGVVCGHPGVVTVNVNKVSGVITSPGYPKNMKRANQEWLFRPSIPNADVFVCFEHLDLSTYGEGYSNATVKDSSNNKLFSLENSSRRKNFCVLMENAAGGKVTLYTSITAPRDDKGKGFRIRYAAVDRSQREDFCSSSWDISAKGEAGKVEVSWNPPPKQSKSGYTYVVVHKSSGSDVRANLTNSTSVLIENLHPNTEYSVRVIAIPLTNEHNSALYSCSKRVRTKSDRTRLTGGKSANEGYVQVYRNGQWTRVCGGSRWDMNDAVVACRSMGLVADNIISYAKIKKKNQLILTRNSRSEQSIWNIRCSGREKNLLRCRFEWFKFCWDAGVACKKPPVSIWRLFGGMVPNEGMLEVYHKGEWGRVCSDRWNMNSAKVACRSMGLPPPPFLLKPVYRRYWRQRIRKGWSNPFTLRVDRKTWIKKPKCRGTEKTLADCQNARMRKTTCRYTIDYVNLVCGQPKVQQIIINDTVGVISSPGYPGYAKQAHVEWIFKPTTSAQAKVLLWGFDFVYDGTRMDLRRSDAVPNERSSLAIKEGTNTLFELENKLGELEVVMASRDVKVSFYSSFTYVYGGSDSDRRRTGFQIKYLVSDKLCHANWNMSAQVKPGRILVNWDAIKRGDVTYKYKVIYNSTREDFKTIFTFKTSTVIDYLTPNTLYSVGVLAYPAFINNAESTDFYFCSVKDVLIDKATTRLIGGQTPFEGIIQLFYQGKWLTISNDKDYDINEARVACRSLGLPDVTYFKMKRVFGRGKGDKQLEGLKCQGNEKSLSDCKHGGLGDHGRYDQDAGVVCGTPTEQHFTITNSSGAIISYGFPKLMPVMHHVYHFPKPVASNAKLVLYLNDFYLERNKYEGDSIVTIKDGTNKTIYQSKNEDGEDGEIGVLEITIKKSWPVTVEVYSSFSVAGRGHFGVNIPFIVVNESCHDWDITLTSGIGFIEVRMKNLKKSNRDHFRYITFYNSSTMKIPDVTESNNYPRATLGRLETKTLYTVSVFGFPYKYTGGDKPFRYCTKNVYTKDVKLRLAGGKSPNEGRVELKHSKFWNMVCGKEWDLNDAMVACRSLGLPEATLALNHSEFGTSKRLGIKMNRVKCVGNETTLSDCPHDGYIVGSWDIPKCKRSPVAGVVCGYPNVTSYTITSLTDKLTSPGFPKSLDQAHYEWMFRPSMSNASVLLCIEQLDITNGPSGTTNVSVVDKSGHQLYAIEGGKISERTHVLIQGNPSKLSFFSHFTFRPSRSSTNKGFRMRYFVFDESCKGNWKITVQKKSGGVNISWSLLESQKNYTFAVVYYTSSENIQSQTPSTPSVMLDNLKPNTEYIIRLFAFVPKSKELSFCSRRVRTD